MKVKNKLKKAFTLIELVVVIAVIAVLAGVSVAAYFGVTESANESQALQEQTQVKDMYTQWYLFNTIDIKNRTNLKGKDLVKNQIDGYVNISLDEENDDLEDVIYGDALNFYDYLNNNGFDVNKINYAFVSTTTSEEEGYVLFLIQSNNRYSTFLAAYNFDDGLYGKIVELNENTTFKFKENNNGNQMATTILEAYNEDFNNETIFEIDKNILGNSENPFEFSFNKDGSFNVTGDNGEINKTILVEYNGAAKGNNKPINFSLRPGKYIEYLEPAKMFYKADGFGSIAMEFLGYSVNNGEKRYFEDDFPLLVDDFLNSESHNKITIKAIYKEDNVIGGLVKTNNDSYAFQNLDDAINFANSQNGDVVVYTQEGQNSVINSKVTINKNVTLNISYDKDNSIGNASSDYFEDNGTLKVSTTEKTSLDPSYVDLDSNSHFANAKESLYSSLKIEENGILNVYGNIVVNGRLSYTQLFDYGRIENEGVINLENGASLSSYGKIIGNGTINAKSGSNVTEKLDIYEWGSISDAKALNDANIFPFNKYRLNKINNFNIYQGAKFSGIGMVYSGTLSHFFEAKVDFISNTTSSLFTINNGYINLSLEDDTLLINVYGDVSDNAIKVSISMGLQTVTIDTSKSYLPVTNFKINIKNEGLLNLSEKYRFMPTSSLEVEKGGTLTLQDTSKINFYGSYSKYLKKVTGEPSKLTINEGAIFNCFTESIGGEINIDQENYNNNINISKYLIKLSEPTKITQEEIFGIPIPVIKKCNTEKVEYKTKVNILS